MNVLRSVTFIVGLSLAVGAFVAYLALGGVLNPPPYEVVVAVRDIPPYTIITSDALARDPQTMSGTVARTLVHAKELNRYVGGMAIEHIHAGEPLRKSAVIAADNPAAARRLSLALDDPARRLTALWGIAADYATGEQLSKEQREELEKRLDNGRSQLPSLVSAAYRHFVVGGPERELRAWDMGAQAYDTSRTLSQRVWDTPKSEEKLLAFLSHGD